MLIYSFMCYYKYLENTALSSSVNKKLVVSFFYLQNQNSKTNYKNRQSNVQRVVYTPERHLEKRPYTLVHTPCTV